jgi:hypothetical protein
MSRTYQTVKDKFHMLAISRGYGEVIMAVIVSGILPEVFDESRGSITTEDKPLAFRRESVLSLSCQPICSIDEPCFTDLQRSCSREGRCRDSASIALRDRCLNWPIFHSLA